MNASPSYYVLKQEIEETLPNLPPDALKEVVDFLDYLRYKYKNSCAAEPPYRPMELGGFWRGQIIAN